MPDFSAITTALRCVGGALPGALLLCATPAIAQDDERWFQIEVSVFSNELAADRLEEVWSPESTALAYPDNLRTLRHILELLMIPEFLPTPEPPEPEVPVEPEPLAIDPAAELAARIAAIAAIGPKPANPPGDFRLIDLLRDAFVQLPPTDSEFQQSNRAIERDSEHRLLFHALWRQPLLDLNEATAIFVDGGLRYGDHTELEGSLTLGFNPSRDRVVVDANLWLTEFSVQTGEESAWQLPSRAVTLTANADDALADTGLVYGPSKVYHMAQQRDMRSGEFHYLDHPALGVVIQVEPYEVPPIPLPELDQPDFTQ